MTELPDLSAFAAAVADRRFVVAAGIAALAGLVRGFSGFGAALIYMPLVSAVYDPRIAAATLLLIDLVCALPFAVQALPRCNWREVAPITLAGALAVPLGAMALRFVDPVTLRWSIAVVVLAFLAALASGWRYHGRPHLAVTAGVGILSGLGSGAVQIGGPPLVIYWLGGSSDTAVVRANLMVWSVLIGAVTLVAYLSQGLLTADAGILSVLLGLPYLAGMTAGARWFHGASAATYRRVAYVIITAAAVISAPVFDSWLR